MDPLTIIGIIEGAAELARLGAVALKSPKDEASQKALSAQLDQLIAASKASIEAAEAALESEAGGK